MAVKVAVSLVKVPLTRVKKHLLSVFRLNMKKPFELRSLKQTIRSLIAPKRSVNVHKLYPIEYYRRYYVNESMCKGIDLIARWEKISKKQAVHLLLEAGFKFYGGEKVRQDIEARTAAKKLNQKIQVSRFIIELEKYCKEQGIDISKAVEFLKT